MRRAPPHPGPLLPKGEEREHGSYVLPDLLAPGLSVVLCGSAVGAASARVGAPYAGPGNKFWPTLHAVGLTPRRFRPEEWRGLLALGIGLTDLNKTQSGSDADLTQDGDDAASLARKIERFRPRIVAFTAKRPASVFLAQRSVAYGMQERRVGDTALCVLPSPSGRAGAFWDQRPWRDLAMLVARPPR